MTQIKLYSMDPKYVRDTLNQAISKADEMLENEKQLTRLLSEIDRRRLFVRYGYKSLQGFCIKGLLLSRIQAQRIVTQVRRTHS